MKRRAYLYFVVIFIVGLAIGGAGTFYGAWRAHVWRRPFNENAVIHRLARRLDLTRAQVQQLRPIMDNTHRQWNQIQDQTKPAVEALRQQTNAHIRQILDPNQQRKFAAMVLKHEKQKQ